MFHWLRLLKSILFIGLFKDLLQSMHLLLYFHWCLMAPVLLWTILTLLKLTASPMVTLVMSKMISYVSLRQILFFDEIMAIWHFWFETNGMERKGLSFVLMMFELMFIFFDGFGLDSFGILIRYKYTFFNIILSDNDERIVKARLNNWLNR